jgi:Ca-activated chloride channel family protein
MGDFEFDCYAVLDVPTDARERSIKQAYRQLVRRYHPDVSDEEGATERFHEIQKAYEVLLDPLQREAHDRWRVQQGLDRPLPLVLRVTPSQDRLPCLGEAQALYVLIELAASEKVESQRLPLNLCLVLDRSTSMKGARLQQVKEAARYIIDEMEPNDVLSVVVFSDRAELRLSGFRGNDKGTARSAISGIRTEGGTEILQGLRLGLEEVERWHSPGGVSHLILLTDGQTYGDEEGCLEAAKLAGENEISLTLMGIGSDWNDKLLDEMAKLSGAPDAAVYIDSTSKIAKAFHNRILRLGSILAQNVTLSLHLGDEIAVKEIFRVSPQIDRLLTSGEKLVLGSLEKQRPQAIIVELLIASRSPGTHRLLQVDAMGVVPSIGRQPVRASQTVTVDYHTDLSQRAPIPSDIVAAMGKVTIFKMQERAMLDIDRNQIESAVTRLKTMATRLLDIGEAELARAALLEAGRLARTGTLSATGQKKIRYGTRGLTIIPKEVGHD